MRRKQREAFGLIPKFAAGTGPRRVKEQFGQKARVRFVSVSTTRVVHGFRGARSLHPVLPTLPGPRALSG